MVVNIVTKKQTRELVLRYGMHTIECREVARTFHKDPEDVYLMGFEYYILERSKKNGSERH